MDENTERIIKLLEDRAAKAGTEPDGSVHPNAELDLRAAKVIKMNETFKSMFMKIKEGMEALDERNDESDPQLEALLDKTQDLRELRHEHEKVKRFLNQLPFTQDNVPVAPTIDTVYYPDFVDTTLPMDIAADVFAGHEKGLVLDYYQVRFGRNSNEYVWKEISECFYDRKEAIRAIKT